MKNKLHLSNRLFLSYLAKGIRKERDGLKTHIKETIVRNNYNEPMFCYSIKRGDGSDILIPSYTYAQVFRNGKILVKDYAVKQIINKTLDELRAEFDISDKWNVQRNLKTGNISKFKNLPANAKKYLKRLEQLLGTKITMVSVGSKRAQTIKVPSCKVPPYKLGCPFLGRH